MIKENQQSLNRIYVLIDAVMIVLSFVLAYAIRFEIFPPQHALWYPLSHYMEWLIYLVPVYLIIYHLCGLYTPMRAKRLRYEFEIFIRANVIAVLCFPVLLYFFREMDISRSFIFIFFGINIFLGLTFRYFLRNVLYEARLRGFNQKHILFVGYSQATKSYIDRILANPEWGYHVYGILDDERRIGHEYKGIKIIGTTEILPQMLAEHTFDEIAITLQLKNFSMLEGIVATCEKSGVHTQFVPDYGNIIPTTAHTEDLDGLPVVNIRHVPLTNTVNRVIKRITDLFGAVVMLIIFGIPMIIVSIIIKATSPGPLIFKQVRVGLHNKEFQMYKFRSMEVQDPAQEKKAWTKRDDPRVTPIGKFIRKTSIDELPQIFNVLKGDMSLVGPRPERPFFVQKFQEEIPRYNIKHQVRPGITGWAQVNGYRGDTSIRKRIEYDLYYIENWTYLMDIKILIMTLFKGFINKNAY